MGDAFTGAALIADAGHTKAAGEVVERREENAATSTDLQISLKYRLLWISVSLNYHAVSLKVVPRFSTKKPEVDKICDVTSGLADFCMAAEPGNVWFVDDDDQISRVRTGIWLSTLPCRRRCYYCVCWLC